MNTYEIFELSSVLIIIIIAIIILIVFGVVLSDILSFILESGNISELYKLTRYLDIKLGMSENKMLNIMGGEYDRSILNKGHIKYEWIINDCNYNKKVIVYVKDRVVESVKTYNVEQC